LLLMPSRSKRLVLLLGLVVFGLSPATALAELTQSDFVLVRPEDTITEDLYAAGNTVRIEGRIEGDLYAVAFNDIVVSGVVTGDVVAMGGRVEISGRVEGSLRAAAGRVVVSGSVGDDVLAASWSAEVTPAGSVGRDLFSWSNRMGMGGVVSRNLGSQGSALSIAGEVGGRVDVTFGRVRVEPTAHIGGDLVYQSPREAEIEGADVGGNVIRRTALPANVRLRGLRLLTYTLALLGIGALALALTWLWPRRVAAAVTVARAGIRTWLTGVVVMLSPVVAAGLLLLVLAWSPPEAGVPLAVVLSPLVLGLLGVVLMVGMVGLVPVAGLVGARILPRRSTAASVLAGVVVLAILVMIPIVHWLVLAIGIPLGIGAWVRHLDLTQDLVIGEGPTP
jgi:cytoskeletal protein CcmA (bactofilin family)